MFSGKLLAIQKFSPSYCMARAETEPRDTVFHSFQYTLTYLGDIHQPALSPLASR